MRKSTKLALAFVALAGAVGSAAYSENNSDGRLRDGMSLRLNKTVKGTSGSISFDEFSHAVNMRLKELASDMAAS